MTYSSQMIKKLLFLFTVLLVTFSCKYSEKESPIYTYIGGEIVNPKGDFVKFYKDEVLIDSIKLDQNNHFNYKTKGLKEGLYSFSHNEYQVFYLKPTDSLMLRVNTIDFDESLSYTGIGAERNNFLMEMFLHNEAEITLMPKLYKLAPEKFELALDSLKEIRTKSYNEFVEKHLPDEAFKEVAEASINYDYYSKKEIYITANERKKGSSRYFEIPENFYTYRKNIDFGSESLRTYFPYYRFLFRYFDNIALTENDKTDYYNRNSLTHNYDKIRLIDSTITNESLKNSMIKNITGRYLLNCNKKEDQKKLLALFLTTNSNKKDQKELIEIANASMKLTAGNKISDHLLITPEKTLKDLHTIIRNPTVIYFWSNKSLNHAKKIHYRVSQLKNKYPEFDYIGINTDTNFNNWKKTVEKYSFNKAKEYQFDNLTKAEKELVIYAVNKTIIVDKNAVIIHGSANIFNSNVDKILLTFLNQ